MRILETQYICSDKRETQKASFNGYVFFRSVGRGLIIWRRLGLYSLMPAKNHPSSSPYHLYPSYHSPFISQILVDTTNPRTNCPIESACGCHTVFSPVSYLAQGIGLFLSLGFVRIFDEQRAFLLRKFHCLMMLTHLLVNLSRRRLFTF